MRTVVLGPPPPELAALIAHRHELGLDGYDEVWDGEYHMAPMAHSAHGHLQAQLIWLLTPWASAAGLTVSGPFNLGDPDDFRVPDGALRRPGPDAVWVPSAALVLEVESPDDETWEKLPFYASHHVEEILIVSPEHQPVTWLVVHQSDYVESPVSELLGPVSASLASDIRWPAIG